MVDDPALSRIEACLKKIPEPMIVPITIEIAEPKPNDRLSSLFSFSIKDTLLKTKTIFKNCKTINNHSTHEELDSQIQFVHF